MPRMPALWRRPGTHSPTLPNWSDPLALSPHDASSSVSNVLLLETLKSTSARCVHIHWNSTPSGSSSLTWTFLWQYSHCYQICEMPSSTSSVPQISWVPHQRRHIQSYYRTCRRRDSRQEPYCPTVSCALLCMETPKYENVCVYDWVMLYHKEATWKTDQKHAKPQIYQPPWLWHWI